MENILIQGLVEEFKNDYALEFKDDANAFESFINYLVVSDIHPEAIDSDISKLDDINIDKGKNFGLDGAAIFVDSLYADVNNILESDLTYNKSFSSKFIFIQSKISTSINNGDFNNFCLSVKNIFKASQINIANHDLIQFISAKDKIFKHSSRFKENPELKIVFAYCGKYQKDKHTELIIEQYRKDLTDIGIFSNIEFVILDSEKISRLYREINNNYKVQILFEHHKPLPKIKNVKSSYIGIINAKEYLKLLIDENDGSLRKNIFDENVRDFQGENNVNQEIESAIKSKDNQDEFCLLNNGITIVVKELNVTGSDFTLTDYQIVNGCQTSSIIYKNRDILTEQMYVPLKIVWTQDNELTNRVTRGTNRQTPVVDEAFEALKQFHQNLELFYISINSQSEIKIYYERRSRQYAHNETKILRSNIITLHSQIRTFTAMFLEEPHSTHRYPGEILKSYKGKIFKDGQSYYPYYISGLTFVVFEKRLNSMGYQKYKKYRYHLMLIAKKLVHKNWSPLESKDIEKQCSDFKKILTNEVEFNRLFGKSLEILNKGLHVNLHMPKYGYNRISSFTAELLKLI